MQPGGGQGSPVLAWIRPPGVHAVFPLGQVAVIANVSPAGSQKEPLAGTLTRLSELPSDVWELVAEPPPGYHYRTHAFTPGVTWDTLLDGGAAFSLIAEESLVHGINCAIASGCTPDSKDWPLAGMQWWGADSKANTVSKSSDKAPASLSVMGVVLFRATLKAIDGREVVQLFKLRILRAGCSSWTGLLLGAPALDQPPLGLGHRATLAGHVLTGLGLVLPRLEDQLVQQGLEGVQIALVNPLASSTLECVTVPEGNVPLFLLEEDEEHEARSICGGDILTLFATQDAVPVVLDYESLSLD